MSPQDHNKSLVFIYSLLGGFFTLPLAASPWIIAKNVDPFPSHRRGDQMLIAVVVFCVVLFLALLFVSAAVGLGRRRPWGRRLVLISSVVLLPLCPPVAAYGWWFMHSEGGRRLYGAISEGGTS